MADYDSRAETLTHIHRVRDHLSVFVAAMLERGRVHDIPPQLVSILANTLARWPVAT